MIYSVISSSLEDFFSYLVNQLQVIDLSSLTQNQLGLFRCLLALYSVFKVQAPELSFRQDGCFRHPEWRW